jgi:hypothetical protein
MPAESEAKDPVVAVIWAAIVALAILCGLALVVLQVVAIFG